VPEVIESLEQVAGDPASNVIAVLDGVADVPTDSTGSTAVDTQLNGVEIAVPVDPADPLVVEGADGLGVMLSNGWLEVVKKQPSANTSVINQQHQCHTLYGWSLGFQDTWDYESWRSSTWNVVTWTKKNCNW
jgi:hypothetical protein